MVSTYSELDNELEDFILRYPETKTDWIRKVWGKWPGNESIEEIMADFEQKN